MEQFRPTKAVVRILEEFLEDPQYTRYGYQLMMETGFSSAKTYQILARLTSAGWLDRHHDSSASPRSGGPPRVTYRLHSAAVPAARRLIAAQHEKSGVRRPRSFGAVGRGEAWGLSS